MENQLSNNQIPVCTLFKDDTTDSKSSSSFFDQTSTEVADEEKANNVQLFNMFENSSTRDDLFPEMSESASAPSLNEENDSLVKNKVLEEKNISSDTREVEDSFQDMEIKDEDSLKPAAALFFSSTQTLPTDSLIPDVEKHLQPEADVFTSALTSSKLESRRSIWIPSENIKNILGTIGNKQKSELEKARLKLSISTLEEIENPIKAHLDLNGSDFSKLAALSADQVDQNVSGLKKLVQTGNFRAAVNLTSKMLTKLGQGYDQLGKLSDITAEVLEWWTARFILLLRLRLFDIVQTEMEHFQNFESADLYYEFYPQLYPGKKGCMVPFSLRLLHANLPTHRGVPTDTLARLFILKNIINQILKDLNNDISHNEIYTNLKPEDVKYSIELWKQRYILVLHCIGSTQIKLREFNLAFKVYNEIIKLLPSATVTLQSFIGRWFLQLGDIKSCQSRFTQAERAANGDPLYNSILTMNKAFLYLGTSNWKEAYKYFEKVVIMDPNNIEALNNKACCLLYLCKIKEAISTLEDSVKICSKIFNQSHHFTRNNQQTLEGICSNLVTLYELESAKFQLKRDSLLSHVATNFGDGFDISCLRL